MRKQMIEDAAFEVATQVRTVEDSIDATLAEIAELQSRMLHINAIANVGPRAIHAALEQLGGALTGLIIARGSIVACHSELADAKTKVPGLRAVATGDTECPPKIARVDLRVVA
jgi:hypothetical protein